MSSHDKDDALANIALKKQIINVALHNFENLDVRTALILQKNGVLSDVKLVDIPEHIVTVLSDDNHPDRVSLSVGPIFVHVDPGDKLKRCAIHIDNLLCSSKKVVRNIALKHLGKMSDDNEQLLTNRSKKTINKFCNDLRSEDLNLWQSAAIEISDAIKDDFFCNLAGFRQSIESNYDDGIKRYLPLILHPSPSSINSIDLPVIQPSEQHKELEEIVDRCLINVDSVYDACNNYYQKLGYLPLDYQFSLSCLIDKWIAQKGGQETIWDEVWEWANNISSPLPRYHACTLFIQNPRLIPKDQFSDLWTEILQIVDFSQKEIASPTWAKAWKMRCELARHYVMHFEVNFPEGHGERIACFSWWVSEQVSSVFDSADKKIVNFEDFFVLPSTSDTSHVWQLSHSRIQPSIYRYVTLFVKSLWGLSLISEMGKNLSALRFTNLLSEQQECFNNTLILTILGECPFKLPSIDNPTFLFERGISATVEALSSISDRDKFSKDLTALLDVYSKTSNPQNFIEVLKELALKNETDQMFISRLLNVMANIGVVPVEDIWKYVSDEKWRKKVFLKVEQRALTIFLGALLAIQIQNGKRWEFDLPHFLALACEEANEDRSRQKLLFNFTILSSVAADSVSAIERLLKGSNKDKFVEDIIWWQQQIKATPDIAPAWIVAKLRAVMASLYIV